ncbi:MAG TPA: hypothetical protein VFD45_01965 [Patescibacteria group bacterium]|nr:hypothetical protein [Patescibacteria group bacterium]
MNESKARVDSPQWAKWRAVGAVGNMESTRKSLMSFNVVYMVLDADRLQIAQEAVRRTGVDVNVVSEGGQTYTTRPSEVWFGDRKLEEYPKSREYTGTLPEDKVFIKIMGNMPARLGLHNFWKKYKGLARAQSSR